MTGHDLHIHLDMAILRLSGEIPMLDAASRVTEAIFFARDHHINKLLVDTMALVRREAPSVAGSYFRIQEWARAAEGIVRIAFVLPNSVRDPRGFVSAVAANSGLIGKVFTNEAEAVEWLRGNRAVSTE